MKLATCLISSAFSIASASAATLDESLMKLDPEERSHQACIARGIDVLNKSDKRLEVDRLKTSIFTRAKFEDDIVTSDGGAVRAHRRWYRLSFVCAVTKNQMRATSFKYELGNEIPKEKWEDLGLWE
jgi:hypothetical protein